MSIKNIIFDLGGVVINLDRNRAVNALSALGIPDVDSLLGLYRQEGPFLMLETGAISAAEFFDTLRQMARPGTTDLMIQDAFNAFLIDIPVERLQELRRLREKGYKLIALSNTNAVMYNSWIDRAFRAEGLAIGDYFDGIVASFQEGCCKPDARIFDILVNRYNLNRDETVLFDDSEANCKAARDCGLHAVCIGADETPDIFSAVKIIEK